MYRLQGLFTLTSLTFFLDLCIFVSSQSCGGGQLCPVSAPCCSQYGECDIGTMCLGGCDPANSFSLNSCAPAPICKNQTFTFENLDRLVDVDEYLGDASRFDFVYSGDVRRSSDGELVLALKQGSNGTFISSTRYIWYGKVTVTLRTSGGRGVVTSLDLFADSKDQISADFVGNDVQAVQIYQNFQSIADASDSSTPRLNDSTFDVGYIYEIDWTPDSVKWSIDGETVAIHSGGLWNQSVNSVMFPQTPARLQLSLWPAGVDTNEQDLIDWAGGLIDWENSTYMATDPDGSRFYHARVTSITFECYKPPSEAEISGERSYVYNSRTMTNDTIEIANKSTVLASFHSQGYEDFTKTTHTGLTTGAKAGIGVGIGLGVSAIAIIAFVIIHRRHRTPPESTLQKKNVSDSDGKAELEAEYDASVAGPVLDKSELRQRDTVKEMTAHTRELSAGWLPAEVHSATAGHPTNPSSRAIIISHEDSLIPSPTPPPPPPTSALPTALSPALATPLPASPAATSAAQATQPSDTEAEPNPKSKPSLTADEADALVQELGLLAVRKRTFHAEAKDKGITPEELEGSRGREDAEIVEREREVRGKLGGEEESG